MNTVEELEICAHCNKEVVKWNLPVHEVHCQRFLCFCPDCEEQIPKDQLQEHRNEQHIVITCKKCSMKMERCKLADHEVSECSARRVNCEYCELDVCWSDVTEHVVACGSRTERCPDCNRYILLKDQRQHADVCSSENDFSFKQKKDGKPVNALMNHQRDKDLQEESFLSLSDRQKEKKKNGNAGWMDGDRISTCPHCHLALPVNTLQWHQHDRF